MPELHTPEDPKILALAAQLNGVLEDPISALAGRLRAVLGDTATPYESKWQDWLPQMGKRTFTGEFAPFHQDFWNWYWPLLLAQKEGKTPSEVSDYLAYLLFLGRGMGKSSSVEWAVIAAGALLTETLVLYVSSTSSLAVAHLNSIRQRIESADVSRYYPKLGTPRIGKYNNRYGWRSDMLATDSGLTVFAVGLEEEVRGVRVGDLRPSLIIFDDVDSKQDSPDVVAKKESIIGGSILPTGAAQTITLFAQNLIHENSVATRMHKRYSDMLSHRKESGLIKAFTDDFEIEQDGNRFLIKQGEPTWKYFDLAACQKFIDDSGPMEAFAEYQHDFDHSKEGLVLKNYRDDIRVITWSEFEAVFKRRTIPDRWYKYVGHDWADTKSQYHANVMGKIAVSGQHELLPGFIFFYDMMSFPEASEPEDVALRFLKSVSPEVPNMNISWESLMEDAFKRDHFDRYITDTRRLLDERRRALSKVLPKYVTPMLKKANFRDFSMSHEAKPANDVYNEVFGIPFQPANPGKDGGTMIWDYLMRVDDDKPHPFRPNVKGYSRVFLIVEDDKINFPHDVKPDRLHDSDLARFQFTHCRYASPKLTETGVKERGILKLNDDFVNMGQMLFMGGVPKAAPMNESEMITAATPKGFTFEELQAKRPEIKGLAAEDELSFVIARDEAKAALRLTQNRRDGFGNNVIDSERPRGYGSAKRDAFGNLTGD